MNEYFPLDESIFAKQNGNILPSLETIAMRYVAQNPKHPVKKRVWQKNGIRRNAGYHYDFNLSELFPEAKNESVVFAAAKLWSAEGGQSNIKLTCKCRTYVYSNGELAFKTNNQQERATENDPAASFKLDLKKGWNSIVIKFVKVESGFGATIGTGSYKSTPLHFLMPSAERNGQEGFIYSKPLDIDIHNTEYNYYEPDSSEKGSIYSYPVRAWLESNHNNFRRIFGESQSGFGIAVANADFNAGLTAEYTFSGTNNGAIEIYVGSQKLFSKQENGKFEFKPNLTYGLKKITIKNHASENWGFTLNITSPYGTVKLDSAFPVCGIPTPWLYLGIFSGEFDIESADGSLKTYETINGKDFWRVDMPEGILRSYNENSNFANWNYPLGVTLYGIMSLAHYMKNADLMGYVTDHITELLTSFEYAMWDSAENGACGIHNLLTTIDSLDDCGSFASCVLELSKYAELPNLDLVSSFVAEYISEKQTRQPDGAFNRRFKTMWADDLYMSVPFLCRYYKRTGNDKYLSDAANQLIQFFRYLYRKDKNIMSHVYDLYYQKPTGVSWGRGNGWVLFSFAELLEIMPEGHKMRGEVMELFKTLCKGYLQYQDDEGMWHQVVDDLESYKESSCTSMFAYAFAKGVINGWLDDVRYVNAANKAWDGLCKIAVDSLGNVYGICRGSGFSFTKNYYKDELSWKLNDTHGTGIVILCGVEIFKMREKIKQNQ